MAHRDLKPVRRLTDLIVNSSFTHFLTKENILVSDRGRACLTDFGLATTFDTQAYMESVQRNICGTWQYMAPELHNANAQQEFDKINKRACDIYALGCTIYFVRERSAMLLFEFYRMLLRFMRANHHFLSFPGVASV